MSIFSEATQVEQISENSWKANLKEGWRIGEVPNGGYVMAIAGRVLSQALTHTDPMSINGFYLAPTQLGEAVFEVDILRTSKRNSFAQLKMFQQGELKVQLTAAFSNLSDRQGRSWSNVSPPELPPWDDCKVVEQPPQIEVTRSVDMRIVEGGGLFEGQEPDGGGVFTAWLRHKDGATACPLSLLMFADIMPPPIFSKFGFQPWVPTIELTVQVRGTPCPGPLKARFKTCQVSGGVMEEDGELWDSNDQLVAISRQSAILRG